MNENLANEIRKTIESVKDMKIQVGGINNYLSILEGMIRADYQKQVDEAYQRGYNKGYADKINNDEIKVGDVVERYINGKFDSTGIFLGEDGDYWNCLFWTGAVFTTFAYPKNQFKKTGIHLGIDMIMEKK